MLEIERDLELLIEGHPFTISKHGGRGSVKFRKMLTGLEGGVRANPKLEF